ncbi:MAG: DNA-binding response regulator [Betaproteobacteria bacterium]|nr:DNA-binding response regulator [Betaproteobacteria bacterium]
METLLIEDDDTIARELAWRWQQRRWRLTHAADLSRARELLSTTGRFDLVLLDRGLPDGDGLVLLGELRGRDAHLPVLILTAQDQVSDRVAGLRLGEARAEALLRRRESQKAQRLSLGPLVWVESQRLATLNGAAMELSPREFEVLGLLLQRAPRLTPKGALVDELAQRNRDADDSVVEVYISRLRRKLQGSGVCIRTLRGFGYVLERDAEG